MSLIEIYDRALCCSTGVCGPEVDPDLPRFAGDIEWLKSQGHKVSRFNLAQSPMAFVENKKIHEVLSKEGTECLPVIMVDGEIVSRKEYPQREKMLRLVGSVSSKAVLPVTEPNKSCCGPKGCC
ncbi:MAG: Arsenical resistance operon trans-acting repressor ArsD [Planctomycetota bacterium]|jgi:sulfur carrier protein ThiS